MGNNFYFVAFIFQHIEVWYAYMYIIHFLSLCIRIVCFFFFLSHPSLHSVLTFCFSRVGEEADDADLEAPKIYEPIPSLDFLAERLKSYQELYNESIRGAKMDLVFFKASWMGFSLLFQMFHDIGYFSLWYDLGMQVKEWNVNLCMITDVLQN